MDISKRYRAYSATEVAQALRDSRGLVTLAAAKLGCSRQTIMNHTERHASVKEALTDAREGMKDRAESKLYDAIEGGEAWGICFYLKTQAKDRGYVEKDRGDDENDRVPIIVQVGNGHGNPT